jgi:site-specific DNA recombinase
MKAAAIYARVSSDQQRDQNTIASQTAALVEFAQSKGYVVPDEWIIQDEGYSGASLVRPGLETIRDLAAEGQIEALLVLSPDRLSRKYAYQMLLIEEMGRHGVETVFINAPQAQTPEEQLLTQFQGMIAEYERAQIMERTRRGKRHRAKHGEVSVLCGAPYGYRYIRKTDEMAARYEIIDEEAVVVREIFALYTGSGMSIGDVVRRLNEQRIATRNGAARWERRTIWGMLRNPAYKGLAHFGKTTLAPRERINNRRQRIRGGVRSPVSSGHETPRDQWIGIPVPALITDEVFALAEERLKNNKRLSARRTIEPSILQGLVYCQHCGYSLYRTSTRSTARKIHYYRCLGSDAWRYDGHAKCDQKPIRQDLLDEVVWQEILRLLEEPALIQAEMERRINAAREVNPAKHRGQVVARDLVRVRKSMERLLTAYQEDLLSLEELRRRMPALRKREASLQAESDALRAQGTDTAAYLRLADTLLGFLSRLRANAQTLDVKARQRILRLLVKEVVVAHDSVTIRHSIRVSGGSNGGGRNGLQPAGPSGSQGSPEGYLLCYRSPEPAAGESLPARAG